MQQWLVSFGEGEFLNEGNKKMEKQKRRKVAGGATVFKPGFAFWWPNTSTFYDNYYLCPVFLNQAMVILEMLLSDMFLYNAPGPF